MFNCLITHLNHSKASEKHEPAKMKIACTRILLGNKDNGFVMVWHVCMLPVNFVTCHLNIHCSLPKWLIFYSLGFEEGSKCNATATMQASTIPIDNGFAMMWCVYMLPGNYVPCHNKDTLFITQGVNFLFTEFCALFSPFSLRYCNICILVC